MDVLVTDFNGDGRPDIVCPGKGGLYLFLNQGVGAVAAKPSVSAEEAKLIAVPIVRDVRRESCCLSRAGTSRDGRIGAGVERIAGGSPALAHGPLCVGRDSRRASEAAFEQYVRTVKGPQLAGVITSIMARGDRWGWAELMSLLKHPDPLVVRAAALASGRIAKPLPIKVMQDIMKWSKEPTRSAMVAGLLAAGDTLLTRRQFTEATAIFDALRR